MSIVKSFSVGNVDMFYINHNSDNFSTIDCCYSDEENRKKNFQLGKGSGSYPLVDERKLLYFPF